ncbi:hypothetical protein L210DRAFT_978319 [Boletus edulis BED1]|uniref:Uncharacterized protein n=1 Tax=Boletus edulis BED1 TaxID=1328754 RepID=A0AAD4GHS8_BOLED|nr:hypothetical protein L210DRAFT_978319 [Boletus edulis BED1]
MPKKKPSVAPSQDLITVGPKHVQKKYSGKRDENGLKPSTSRALILRNGKYGARGTGEVMLAGRISGREKLDLLAEDLVSQRSRTALMAPFKLDKCIRIAESQYNAYLDDIADLKDPDWFYDRIVAELATRSPHGTDDSQQAARNPSHVASVVSTRIHNAYLVASGWRLVADTLRDLQNSGLNDATARAQLQSDDSLRSRYLVLCDIIGTLVDLGQAHFSILATTTPHYTRYFKEVENVQPGDPTVAFDWAGLKDACKSFLDSIIIELCFPRSPYPKRILYHILHDAVDESPREAKRFPQSMWDAVGDLSVSLELRELLESPLLGPEGEKLRTLPRQMPEQYDKWLDAQIYSNKASESYANFKDLIHPLERTKDASVLDNMWKRVNLNYKTTSGLSIDSLWGLDEALRRTPQWSSFYMPSLRTYDSDSDDGKPSKPRLKAPGQRKTSGNKKPKKLLAITSGHTDDEDSNGSMPGLQSVSDSSGDNDEDIFVSENDKEEESDDDDETDYDSEDEELYRIMLREAMDTAMAIPEFFDPKTNVSEFDALAEERKGNPFLKLLGSLRGKMTVLRRMFSSNPKLSSTTRSEPRKGLFGQKGQTAKPSAKQGATSVPRPKTSDVSGGKTAPTQPAQNKERQPAPAPEEPKDLRATVEDAEDEEDFPSVASKKKKKPKKKKKKTVTNELPTVHEDSVPAISTPPKSRPSSTFPETPAKVPSNTLPPSNASLSSLGHMSTSSLPIEPTIAQSARSYIQELGAPKEKVKSRPNHASLFSDKRGFLSKLGSKDKTKEDEDGPSVNKKFTWFNKLGKKTTEYMHQLIRTKADEKIGPLKWENFLKVMREMGFKYDPSTAGSSVRFDPPNPKDRSITIHKPHPDSTLYPSKLREIGARLKSYYGWSEEDFLKRTSAI